MISTLVLEAGSAGVDKCEPVVLRILLQTRTLNGVCKTVRLHKIMYDLRNVFINLIVILQALVYRF